MKKLLLLVVAMLLTSVASIAATYSRVNDFSTLQAGDKIILFGDYLQSGTNPYWLVTMNLTDAGKTNIPGQVLDKSSTAKKLGDSYEVPDGINVTEITLVESGDETYPWLLQVSLNDTDYYLCCTSTATKNNMSCKAIADKTDACMAKFDGTFQFKTASNITRNSLEISINNGKTGETIFNCYAKGGQKTPVVFKAENPTQENVLGEIIVKDAFGNTYTSESSSITIEEGVVLTFSAENAAEIQVELDNYLVAGGQPPVEWTYYFPSHIRPDEEVSPYSGILTVKAMLGEQSVTATFSLMVTPKPVIPIELGEIIVNGPNYENIQEGDILQNVPAGSIFSINVENAESISVNGDMTLGSHAEWTAPELPGEYDVIINAERGQKMKSLNFVVRIEEKENPAIGDLVVTYGEGEVVNDNPDFINYVTVGTTFTAYAENATHITVELVNSRRSYPFEGNSGTWTFDDPIEKETVLVYAYDDLESNQKSMMFTVTVTPKPLGDIVVTYGDGVVVEEGDNGLSVETGTTFIINAENATHITATRWSDYEDVIDVDSDKATYTVNDPISYEGLTITATNGIDTKEFEFLLSVTEPIVPETTTWSLVTKDMVIVPGQEYVIAGTGVDRNDTNIAVDYILNTYASANNRISSSIIEIDKTNKSISLTSETNYQKVVFEKADDKGFYAKSESKYFSAYKTSAGKIQNQLRLIEQLDETLCYIKVDIDDNGDALLKFVKMADDENSCPWVHLFSQKSADTYWNCYTNHSGKKSYQLYTQVMAVIQPEVPAFDLMEDDATKVALMSTKGELHVWTVEYDRDGNAVKENGQDVAASVMAKAPAADDTAWTNKVAEEGENYEIYVPVTTGNYLSIRAKSVLGDLHSEELVKNVDASGNIISSVEGVAADDMNAPVEYFSLQGVRVAADQPGLYIRRQGSKVEKVAIAR